MNITNATSYIFETSVKSAPLKTRYYIAHVDTLKLLKSFQLSTTIPEWTDVVTEAHTFRSTSAANRVIYEGLRSCWWRCKVIYMVIKLKKDLYVTQ